MESSLNNQDFLEVRTRWYAAYVAGDTRGLEALEDPGFIVVGPAGIQRRVAQLADIADAVRSGRWFPAGSSAQDRSLDLRQLGADVVSAHGTGRIVTPRGGGPDIVFTEIWQRGASGWRAVHLHYHEASR